MARILVYPIAAVFLLLLPPVEASFSLGSPLPHSGVRLTAIDNGEVGLSLFEGDPLALQILGSNGGAAPQFQSIDTTRSVVSFRIDGQTYTTMGLPGTLPAQPTQTVLNGTMAAQEWDFGDLRAVLNITLVDNAARFHWRFVNEGAGPHDFGLRQMFDTYLTGVDTGHDSGPYLRIPGQPGDLQNRPEIYHTTEQQFRNPAFGQVFARRTPEGPDDGVHARITWTPALGGTPPEDVMIAAAPRPFQNPWDYSPSPGVDASGDNNVLLYWGLADPLRLDPGGSRHFVYWYGRATPTPFLIHRVDAAFTGEDGDEDQRLIVADAGQVVDTPFEVVHRGTLGPAGSRSETLALSLRSVAVPPGWSARLVGPAGDADAPPTVTLATGQAFRGRLRVLVPPDAAGDDQSQFEITARVTPTPADVDHLRDRTEAKIVATVAVVPRLKAGLHLDDATQKTAVPGGSVTFNLTVTNQANLRDPVPILLEAGSLLPSGWRLEFSPGSRLEVARGASEPASVQITVPPDEFGGLHDLVLRARVAGRADANTTQVSIRVAHEPQLEARPDAAERLVPPGGSRVFRIQFHNGGLDAVPFEAQAEFNESSPWTVSVAPPTIPSAGLAPGARATMLLTMRAPLTAVAGQRFEVPIVAVDPATRRVIANTSVVGVAAAAAKIDVEADAAVWDITPGETIETEITATNRGNAFDNVTLAVTTAPHGLELTAEPRPLLLPPGASGKIRLRLSLPRDVPASDHDIVLEPRSEVDPEAPVSEIALRLRVAEIRDLRLGLDRVQYDARPGQRLVLHADVINRGNAPVAFTVSGSLPGWTLRLVGDSAAPLPMNETRRIELALLIPSSAPLVPHTFDLRLVPSAGGAAGPDAQRSLAVRLAQADLRVEELQPGASEPRVGEPWSITARFSNVGNGAATGVRVRLLVDGVETEAPVHIQRLPAGRTATATLLWVPTPGDHVLAVIVESDDPAGDARPENNQRTLQVSTAAGSALAEPGGAAPVAVLAPFLAVSFALLWRRRRP